MTSKVIISDVQLLFCRIRMVTRASKEYRRVNELCRAGIMLLEACIFLWLMHCPVHAGVSTCGSLRVYSRKTTIVVDVVCRQHLDTAVESSSVSQHRSICENTVCS